MAYALDILFIFAKNIEEHQVTYCTLQLHYKARD